MDNFYRDNILDHYKNPRNFGHLKNATASAQAYNATCGDRIEIEIKCQMTNDKCQIKDIRFSGEGCAISQASASMLTELVKDKSQEEICKLKTDDILKMLGTTLTPSRIKCAVLPLEVINAALEKVSSNRVK